MNFFIYENASEIIVCEMAAIMSRGRCVNTLRPRQNGRHYADDIFKCIFLNENVQISIKISLKFVPKVPINNIPSLVQIMAWRRSGNKPFSEPMLVSLPMHICVIRPQWVNITNHFEAHKRNSLGCWHSSPETGTGYSDTHRYLKEHMWTKIRQCSFVNIHHWGYEIIFEIKHSNMELYSGCLASQSRKVMMGLLPDM